jgi:hypothetical protein
MPNSKLQIGVLPSLEVLPFFEEGFMAATPLRFAARSSYGSIARDMLTGTLHGGILPWEIFVADVFALPGERDHWQVPFFPHAFPAELVLKRGIHRALHASRQIAERKSPARVTIRVASRNSLMRHQLLDWLGQLPNKPNIEIVFKFLPTELMLKALAADALGGMMAVAPWGITAHEKQLAVLETGFKPGKFAQQLCFAHRKDTGHQPKIPASEIIANLAGARERLANPAVFEKAAELMAAASKGAIPPDMLALAYHRHAASCTARDIVSDMQRISSALKRLDSLSLLPPQVVADERSAKLLLPA